MAYWQIYLFWLFSDLLLLAGELVVVMIAMSQFCLVCALVAPRIVAGVKPAHSLQVWRRAWIGSLAGYLIWKFAMLVVAALRGRPLFDFLDSLLISLGVSALACALCWAVLLSQRFIAAPIAQPPAPPRWRFSLRTLIACQLLLVLPVGMWSVTRRQEMTEHLAQQRRHDKLRLAQQRFEPYGWKVTMAPRGNADQLVLTWDYVEPDAFHSEALQFITPADDLLRLEIVSDKLSSADLTTIGQFTSLERVRLCSNRITDASLAELAKLPRLKTIHVESNQITDAGVAQLCQLPELRDLVVSSPHLTDRSLKDLQNVKTLRLLCLYSAFPLSKIDREKAQAFQAARPEVQGWFNQEDPFKF